MQSQLENLELKVKAQSDEMLELKNELPLMLLDWFKIMGRGRSLTDKNCGLLVDSLLAHKIIKDVDSHTDDLTHYMKDIYKKSNPSNNSDSTEQPNQRAKKMKTSDE